jgi:3-oxoacid CoA-transferase subunit B/acetate CoA/acetoacetate CoA-transferase beta subunit
MIPGKMVPGMGGAMDLVTGARAVYVATTHCDKKGRPKLVKECTLPLTGEKVVSVVVTEFCVIRKVNGKMVLCEISPEITEEELRANTTMDYDISPDLCPMKGIE